MNTMTNLNTHKNSSFNNDSAYETYPKQRTLSTKRDSPFEQKLSTMTVSPIKKFNDQYNI